MKHVLRMIGHTLRAAAWLGERYDAYQTNRETLQQADRDRLQTRLQEQQARIDAERAEIEKSGVPSGMFYIPEKGPFD